VANDTQTVGGKTTVVTAIPDMSTNPTVLMTTGDALGGLLTFNSAGSSTRKSGLIVGATLIDLAAQATATDLILYSVPIGGGTNNVAYDPTDAEIMRCIGKVSFVAGDYSTFTDNSIAHIAGLAIPFRIPSGALGISNVAASGSLIAVTTLTAHGLSTGARVWVEDVSGVNCPTPSEGHLITVTSSTAFTMDGTTHSGTYVQGTGTVRTSKDQRPHAIYGQLVTRGGPTYAADGDIRVKLHILQD
jgi:hypothetical protein